LGCPLAQPQTSLTVGVTGPMLLQDFVYLDRMQKFNRERAPERVVHAKGVGVHGYFKLTKDCSQLC
jgi:catalase